MKLYKKISLAASIFAVATLSSCSDKGYWDKAPLEEGLSFQCAQYNENLGPGANTIVIPLMRTVTTGDQTVNLTFTPGKDCPEDITVPGSVTFTAGSNQANIKIQIADAMPPYTYSGKLEFTGDPSYAGVSAINIKCPVNYTWVSLGEGVYLDAFVMDEPYPAEIIKAEGFERYRVLNPYKAYYETDAAKEDYGDMIGSSGTPYVEFWELDNGDLYFDAFNTGLLYQGVAGQEIWAYPWDWFNGTEEGLDIWYAPGFAVLSPVYYIDGVGGWGQQQYCVQIELPE